MKGGFFFTFIANSIILKNFFYVLLVLILFISCKSDVSEIKFIRYDESQELIESQNHERSRMRFKLIQSKFNDMNVVFQPFEKDLARFSEADYKNLEPYILEKSIPEIQESVKNRVLSYEQITLFYLYRIRKFESDSTKSLNSIISLNPNVIQEARLKDRSPREHNNNSLYGLPILLKDNINTAGMPTTAGAFALLDNKNTNDAFIVKKLKENGALILGKVNLSEWAYYFCSGCPLGYSAVGGQTLNPYGRGIFETGGSSSGSGVSVAANYAVAAVGTETSGSILSPSSKNSVVGLKPTIGLLSRSGIVPISSTLDTPGPITKSVIDNAIFLEAMLGEDSEDFASVGIKYEDDYLEGLSVATFKGKRIGVMNTLLNDSIYKLSVEKIKNAGAQLVYYDPIQIRLSGFQTLLTGDMKRDLPNYISTFADTSVKINNVGDVVQMNNLDSITRAPYGQQLFDGIAKDTTSDEWLKHVKANLNQNGLEFFREPMIEDQLDAVLSINNYHVSYAAVAKYPCMTVPMGFELNGEPKNLTFIGAPFSEKQLLELAASFESLGKIRKRPVGY